MKSASNTRSSEPSTILTSLREFPPNDVTAGVDWARDENPDQHRALQRVIAAQTAAG